MKPNTSLVAQEILKIISKDRIRTNLLRNSEQKALVSLVQHIPSWVSPDLLTFVGFLGSLTVLLSFILATYINRYFLLLSLAGFFINWFGDSLDGRLAIYRNKSRKWYGFSLDLSVDWITTIVIGLGFVFYTEGAGELLGLQRSVRPETCGGFPRHVMRWIAGLVATQSGEVFIACVARQAAALHARESQHRRDGICRAWIDEAGERGRSIAPGPHETERPDCLDRHARQLQPAALHRRQWQQCTRAALRRDVGGDDGLSRQEQTYQTAFARVGVVQQ